MARAPCGGAGRSLPAMRPLRQPTAASTTAAPARRAAAAVVLALMVCLGAGATRGAWAAAENPPPPTHPAAATAGAAPSAAAQPSPLAKPQPTAAAQTDERVGVVDFLGEMIAWYRQLDTEERLAIEPAESLFVDDDRQMALQVARLAFQYARAKAALLKSEKAPVASSDQASVGGAPGKAGTVGLPGLPGLAAKTQDNLKQLTLQAEQLKAESASAKAARRPALARQLATVQSQIELAQSRLDSYGAILQFQTTAISAGTQSAGLAGQIDALERGLPQLNASAKGAAPAAAAQGAPPVAAAVRSLPEPATASDSGLLGAIEALFRLGREESALDGRIDDTGHLAALTNAARAPLIARLRDLNARADALAAQSGGDDLAANRARKQEFDRLIARHKTITDALIPLSKQGVVLQLYVANLQRWKGSVRQRSDNQLHLLVVRLSALGVVLLAIFVGAFIWRSLTFRYVQDLRRRRQLLQLRKLTVALVVGLVLLFDFASQLGTLATVMGLAAAGVALALQNVILSFAGYFFVTGRYGIRVGDRDPDFRH